MNQNNEPPVEPDQDTVWKAIVLIQLNRIYDVLCLIGGALTSNAKIDELIEFHKNGGTYSPPPARMDENDSND